MSRSASRIFSRTAEEGSPGSSFRRIFGRGGTGAGGGISAMALLRLSLHCLSVGPVEVENRGGTAPFDQATRIISDLGIYSIMNLRIILVIYAITKHYGKPRSGRGRAAGRLREGGVPGQGRGCLPSCRRHQPQVSRYGASSGARARTMSPEVFHPRETAAKLGEEARDAREAGLPAGRKRPGDISLEEHLRQ